MKRGSEKGIKVGIFMSRTGHVWHRAILTPIRVSNITNSSSANLDHRVRLNTECRRSGGEDLEWSLSNGYDHGKEINP